MPRLYPGVLSDDEVTFARGLPEDRNLQVWPQRATELRTTNEADDRRDTGVASRLFRADLPEAHQLPPSGESQGTSVRV